ncbi:hypothetical protein AVEN_49331-1 [Araneus ventricosus]|uniref:Uncharacterized protein n=1 Tax=Araneus ventricosus TaxID=182803 RepID=A0A4Y2HA69_ARAVE|nr:hypothetical protein AVEN_49331-1 [Araneus ventricosus]
MILQCRKFHFITKLFEACCKELQRHFLARRRSKHNIYRASTVSINTYSQWTPSSRVVDVNGTVRSADHAKRASRLVKWSSRRGRMGAADRAERTLDRSPFVLSLKWNGGGLVPVVLMDFE